ncbi:MAG: hypothetical protein GX272_08450 [Epulopiscium sp.]|nr:hypothetical protein [Candidatus Epulonipiscium sp.]
MNEEFVQVYNSKGRFLQSYIDSILLYNKRGDFVRKVLFRAWSIYFKGCVKFDEVRKHLDSKFTDYEMQVILQEKERRAYENRCRKQEEQELAHIRGYYRRKAKKLRMVELKLAMAMGYSFDKLAEELNTTTLRLNRIFLDGQSLNLTEEVKDLCQILETIQSINQGNKDDKAID